MEDYQKRLLNECKELQERVCKLYIFISENDMFKKLEKRKQKLLKKQHQTMLNYEKILVKRLELEGFTNKELSHYLKGGEI